MAGSTPPPPKLSRRPSTGVPRTSYRDTTRRGSGQHPAVQAYRDKLQSIHENTVPAVAALDEELQRYLVPDPEPDPFPPATPPPTPPKGPTR